MINNHYIFIYRCETSEAKIDMFPFPEQLVRENGSTILGGTSVGVDAKTINRGSQWIASRKPL